MLNPALGHKLGIDELFWKHTTGALAATPPGQMAPNAAVGFFLIGGGLIMLAVRRAGRWVLPLIAGAVTAFALVPLLGYATAWLIDGAVSYRGMAMPTVTVMLVLAAALLGVTRAEAAHATTAQTLLAAAVGMLISIGVAAAQSHGDLVRANHGLVEGYTVRAEIDHFVEEVARFDSVTRAYALTGESYFLERAEAHRRLIRAGAETVRTLVADNPDQSANAGRLLVLVEEKFAQGERLLRARDTGGVAAAERELRAALEAPDLPASTLTQAVETARTAENRILAARDADRRSVEANANAVQILGYLLALGLLGAAGFAARRAAWARDRSETELRVSQERLTRIFGAVGDGIVFQNARGGIEECNAAAEQILGLTRDQMMGRTSADPHWRAAREDGSPCPADEHPASITLRTGVPVRGFVMEVNRRENDRVWVSVNTEPLRSPEGGVVAVVVSFADITAQRRAEAARRESEERLRLLVAHVREYAIYLLDPEGRVASWNEGAERIKGYAANEIIGEGFGKFFSPEDRTAGTPQRLLRDARAHGRNEEEGIRVRKDGTEFLASVVITPLRNEAGALVGFVEIARDITERKRVERALSESETRFRSAFDDAGIGMALVGLDGRWLRVNPALCATVGYAAEELREKTFQEITHPDDLNTDLAHVENLLAGRASSYRMEKRYIHRDGHTVWINLTGSLVRDGGGKPVHFVAQIEDITVRKHLERALLESEERTRLFAEHAPASVAMFDREMRYLVVSRQWRVDYKLGDGPLVGRSHYEVFPEIPERWKQIHRDCLAGAVVNTEADMFARADGSRQWLCYEVRPWRRATGEIGGIVMFTQDISARKHLEESLAQARDQALEASRLKSEFLATMSHEIRTPMNAVVGMAGLLADTEMSAEQDEMVRTIIGGAETLLTIINDILDFSRIEAGQLRFDQADFDFRKVVEETVALLAPRAHEKRVELICEFAAVPAATVQGDSGRVRQVLTNLIGNAVKFTERGEVAVIVKLLAATKGPGWSRVRIAVRDTGIGIPREAQRRLFQPFMQADGSTTRRFGGTGLGLAISRQLVELMGGKIGYESEPGRGSVFWFELEFALRSALPRAPVVVLPPGRRVLAVDDNETNRRILVGQLAQLGLEVEAVADAATALGRLRDASAGPWHLVLLDWDMPKVSGLELAVELRADAALSHLPLVMLSSAGPMGDIGSAAAAGFAAFLTKPVTALQLNRCVSRVLAESAELHSKAGDRRKPQAPVAAQRRLRLLLAEDNPANQRVASMLLEKMGHTVTVAGNGEIALEKLAAQTFDAVLMDCQMPLLDGYGATRRIRSGALAGVNRQIPIIALTAYARTEDRARCLEAGMDHYVTKPIRAAELRAALDRCDAPAEAGVAPADAASLAAPAMPGPVIDERAFESVRELTTADGASLLPELIMLYLADEPQRLEQLDDLAARGDGEQLGDAVHGFGGNAATFGGIQVRVVALNVETAARAGDWREVGSQLGSCARSVGACGRKSPCGSW